MPYYIAAGEPEWDEYMNMLEDDDHGEPPTSLFKYAEPWTVNTSVLQFSETPGPKPTDRNADPSPGQASPRELFERFQREQKLASDLALWNLSGITAKCRASGVKRVFGSYDGGGDESFTYLRSVEMSDGRLILPEATRAERTGIDYDQLIADAAAAFMGHRYDAGEFVLYGAVVIDFDACTVTDERDVNVVFGQ
jgi:hypothetical protein